jgi:hypothetical protein
MPFKHPTVDVCAKLKVGSPSFILHSTIGVRCARAQSGPVAAPVSHQSRVSDGRELVPQSLLKLCNKQLSGWAVQQGLYPCGSHRHSRRRGHVCSPGADGRRQMDGGSHGDGEQVCPPSPGLEPRHGAPATCIAESRRWQLTM